MIFDKTMETNLDSTTFLLPSLHIVFFKAKNEDYLKLFMGFHVNVHVDMRKLNILNWFPS